MKQKDLLIGFIIAVVVLVVIINSNIQSSRSISLYEFLKQKGGIGLLLAGFSFAAICVTCWLFREKAKKNVARQLRKSEDTLPPITTEITRKEPTTQDLMRKIIAQRQLRPLGNKKRLGFVEGKDCNDYRAQFRDRVSAERYYEAFVKYAEHNPPPMIIEVMIAYTPNTIYSEKYSFILPYFNVGVREDYQNWGREAILNCNDMQRQHSYCAGNSYGYVPQSISAQGAVIRWTILPPTGFDHESQEAQELLSDPQEMGFTAVKMEGQGDTVPDKPDPAGPWIGVLFDISRFSEVLYGKAATKQLFSIVGEKQLAGCVIHGGDLLPDARYWCNAIHTATLEQSYMIADLVAKSGNDKLAQDRSPVIHGQQVPVNTLPFQGFVSKDGAYVGN